MRIRQVIPTKFATANRTSFDDGKTWEPRFVTWWMWAGKCFKIKSRMI